MYHEMFTDAKTAILICEMYQVCTYKTRLRRLCGWGSGE
jgi:hypothetical protein